MVNFFPANLKRLRAFDPAEVKDLSAGEECFVRINSGRLRKSGC
jgi:hypothetical protein